MTPKSAPNPRDHSLGGCEQAKKPGCICGCHGASHQSTVLREAVRTENDVPDRDRTEPLTKAEFDDLLTRVFGQRFTSLDAPTDGQISRRTWNPDAQTGGQRSQREQRIVDVTLRDVLAITFDLPDEAKQSWLTILDALTLKTGWDKFAAQLDNLGLETTPQSGYFWSALLAALSATAPHITLTEFHPDLPGSEGVADAIRRVVTDGKDHGGQEIRGYDVFGMWCMPRHGKPTPIRETAHPEAVHIGADLIGDAADLAAGKGLAQGEFLLLTQIVGAAVSADLWHQPASVRYLLTAAVTGLRAAAGQHRADGVRFSLDGQTPDTDDIKKKKTKKKKADKTETAASPGRGENLPVERLIAEELGARWRTRQHWGPRGPDQDRG
ncbi:hypothetical protein BB736_025135 (plasmid) [Mycobacterium avium subsp. hominissuis]|nr:MULTISPECIES: hypothetical protein [Mycobacterium avium complex (MAC)]MCF1815611.1 hypothetical protein [Mycobacterium intracellulare subsp. intracellulare]MDS0337513.1 hypothetical protein [Mycobacterium intracellulare]